MARWCLPRRRGRSYGVARMRSITLWTAAARAVVTSASVSWLVIKTVVVAIPTTPKARTMRAMISSTSEKPASARVSPALGPDIS